jgi:cytochrome c oxidase accessory protein FixG
MPTRPRSPVSVPFHLNPVIQPVIEPAHRIQPRATQGRLTRWRWAMVLLTQAFFLGVPWLQVDGRQALLFHLEHQRFDVFGLVLWPQDLIYLTGVLVASALLLFLATALAGRVWCGFTCPQTVYTEIFVWIEHRFEGDRSARLRLDAAPWTADKLLRRGGRHLAWIAFSLWTGFTFVGYFTPMRELAASVPAATTGPWEIFWVLFYGLATWGNAGWLREKVCLHMCPYARFQGSLMDRHTQVVSYDAARGEPRQPGRARVPGAGDCIDCTMCVQVCPVGIDIREGLQYECIGCGVCIDACDRVMARIQRPTGLIRFAARDGQAGVADTGLRDLLMRPRVGVYAGLLGLTLAAMVWGMAQRAPLGVDVLRDRGVMARPVEDGAVENVYRLRLRNNTGRSLDGRLSVRTPDGLALVAEPDHIVSLPAAGTAEMVLGARLPAEQALERAGRTLPIELVIETPIGEAVQERSTFIVPRG